MSYKLRRTVPGKIAKKNIYIGKQLHIFGSSQVSRVALVFGFWAKFIYLSMAVCGKCYIDGRAFWFVVCVNLEWRKKYLFDLIDCHVSPYL